MSSLNILKVTDDSYGVAMGDTGEDAVMSSAGQAAPSVSSAPSQVAVSAEQRQQTSSSDSRASISQPNNSIGGMASSTSPNVHVNSAGSGQTPRTAIPGTLPSTAGTGQATVLRGRMISPVINSAGQVIGMALVGTDSAVMIADSVSKVTVDRAGQVVGAEGSTSTPCARVQNDQNNAGERDGHRHLLIGRGHLLRLVTPCRGQSTSHGNAPLPVGQPLVIRQLSGHFRGSGTHPGQTSVPQTIPDVPVFPAGQTSTMPRAPSLTTATGLEQATQTPQRASAFPVIGNGETMAYVVNAGPRSTQAHRAGQPVHMPVLAPDLSHVGGGQADIAHNRVASSMQNTPELSSVSARQTPVYLCQASSTGSTTLLQRQDPIYAMSQTGQTVTTASSLPLARTASLGMCMRGPAPGAAVACGGQTVNPAASCAPHCTAAGTRQRPQIVNSVPATTYIRLANGPLIRLGDAPTQARVTQTEQTAPSVGTVAGTLEGDPGLMTRMPDVCPATGVRTLRLVNRNLALAGQPTQTAAAGPGLLRVRQRPACPGPTGRSSRLTGAFPSRAVNPGVYRVLVPACFPLPRQPSAAERPAAANAVTSSSAQSPPMGEGFMIIPAAAGPGVSVPQEEIFSHQVIRVPLPGYPKGQAYVLVPVPNQYQQTALDVAFSTTSDGSSSITAAVYFTSVPCTTPVLSTASGAVPFRPAPLPIVGASSLSVEASTSGAVTPVLAWVPASSTPVPTHEASTMDAATLTTTAASTTAASLTTAVTSTTTLICTAAASSTSAASSTTTASSTTSVSSTATASSNTAISTTTAGSTAATAGFTTFFSASKIAPRSDVLARYLTPVSSSVISTTCSSSPANSFFDSISTQSGRFASSIARATSSTAQSAENTFSPSQASSSTPSVQGLPSSLHPCCRAGSDAIDRLATIKEGVEDEVDDIGEESSRGDLFQSDCRKKSRSQKQAEISLDGDEAEVCKEGPSQSDGTNSSPLTKAKEVNDFEEQQVEAELLEVLGQSASSRSSKSTTQGSGVVEERTTVKVLQGKALPPSTHRRKSLPRRISPTLLKESLMDALYCGDSSGDDRATNNKNNITLSLSSAETITSMGGKNPAAKQEQPVKVDEGAAKEKGRPEPRRKETGTLSLEENEGERDARPASSSVALGACREGETSTSQSNGGDGKRREEVETKTNPRTGKKMLRQDIGDEVSRVAGTPAHEKDDPCTDMSSSDADCGHWRILQDVPSETTPTGARVPLVIKLRREQKTATQQDKSSRGTRETAKKRRHGTCVGSNPLAEEPGTDQSYGRLDVSPPEKRTSQDGNDSEQTRADSEQDIDQEASLHEGSDSTQTYRTNGNNLGVDEPTRTHAGHVVTDHCVEDSVALDSQTGEGAECALVISNVVGSFREAWLDSLSESDRHLEARKTVEGAAVGQNKGVSTAAHPRENGQSLPLLPLANSSDTASLSGASASKEKDKTYTHECLKARPTSTCPTAKAVDAVTEKNAGATIEQLLAQQRESNEALVAMVSRVIQGKMTTHSGSLKAPVARQSPAGGVAGESSSATLSPADWETHGGAGKKRKLHGDASGTIISGNPSVIAANQSSEDHSLHCRTTGHDSADTAGSLCHTPDRLSLRNSCDTSSLAAGSTAKIKGITDITKCSGHHQHLVLPPAAQPQVAERERNAAPKQATAHRREENRASPPVVTGPFREEETTDTNSQDPLVTPPSPVSVSVRSSFAAQIPAGTKKPDGGKKRKHCESATEIPSPAESPKVIVFECPSEGNGLCGTLPSHDSAELANLQFQKQVERQMFPWANHGMQVEPVRWDPCPDEETYLMEFRESLLAGRSQMEQVIREVDAKLKAMERETERQEGVHRSNEDGQRGQDYQSDLFGQENGRGRVKQEQNDDEPSRGSVLNRIEIVFSPACQIGKSSATLSGSPTDSLPSVDVSESQRPFDEESNRTVQDDPSELPSSSKTPGSNGVTDGTTCSAPEGAPVSENRPSMLLLENMAWIGRTLSEATMKNPLSEFPHGSTAQVTQQASDYRASGGEIYPTLFPLFSVPAPSDNTPDQNGTADDQSSRTETCQGGTLQPSLSFDDLWDNRVIQTGVSDEEWSPASDESRDPTVDSAAAAEGAPLSYSASASCSNHTLQTDWERLNYLGATESSQNSSSRETPQDWDTMWKQSRPFWMASELSLSKVNKSWVDSCEDPGCAVTNTWINREPSWTSTSPDNEVSPSMHSVQRRPFLEPRSSPQREVSSPEILTSSAVRQVCKKRKSSHTAPRLESGESTPEKRPRSEVFRSVERASSSRESPIPDRDNRRSRSSLQSRCRVQGKNSPPPEDVILVDDDSSSE